MIYKVTLFPTYGKVENRNKFIISNEPLILEFGGDYNLAEAVVKIEHEDGTARDYALKSPFRVPNAFVKCGTLYITVFLTSRGEKTKAIVCEPLLLTEMDGVLECVPQLDKIANEIDTIGKKMNIHLQDYLAFRSAVSDQFTKTTEAINALIDEINIIKGELNL